MPYVSLSRKYASMYICLIAKRYKTVSFWTVIATNSFPHLYHVRTVRVLVNSIDRLILCFRDTCSPEKEVHLANTFYLTVGSNGYCLCSDHTFTCFFFQQDILTAVMPLFLPKCHNNATAWLSLAYTVGQRKLNHVIIGKWFCNSSKSLLLFCFVWPTCMEVL